jgi:mannose-6-phosphate isomerase-like protein (cupin superfamily)
MSEMINLQKPDYQGWMQQPLIWTERIRSRALVWTPDANWFINDPLGPLPHAHDDATEIIYIAAGQMDIQVGESKQRVGPGDVLLMPPDRFHNYWLAGDETVCMYVLVVPNHKQARWRYKDFKPGSFEGHAPVANVNSGQPIPSDERITIHLRELAPGASTEPEMETVREKMLYILEGMGRVEIERMQGALKPNDYQHIPATHRHCITNMGATPFKYLELVCYDPTAPVAIRPEDAHMAQGRE